MTIPWDVPLPSNSHRQDYEPFLVGNPYKSYKPSFVTVTGRMDNPYIYIPQYLVSEKWWWINHGSLESVVNSPKKADDGG